jgi:hypothetical protein
MTVESCEGIRVLLLELRTDRFPRNMECKTIHITRKRNRAATDMEHA